MSFFPPLRLSADTRCGAGENARVAGYAPPALNRARRTTSQAARCHKTAFHGVSHFSTWAIGDHVISHRKQYRDMKDQFSHFARENVKNGKMAACLRDSRPRRTILCANFQNQRWGVESASMSTASLPASMKRLEPQIGSWAHPSFEEDRARDARGPHAWPNQREILRERFFLQTWHEIMRRTVLTADARAYLWQPASYTHCVRANTRQSAEHPDALVVAHSLHLIHFVVDWIIYNIGQSSELAQSN